MKLHTLVVMPDHVHFLATIFDDEIGNQIPIYTILGDIKSASVHRLNKKLNRIGKVWVNESFDRMLRSGEFDGCVEYIKMNPVRKGLVKNPDDYEWLWYERDSENAGT